MAAARGLADAEIAATAKHFPGLGRVSGNTDTTSGVTDTVTTADDPYLLPFKQAVARARAVRDGLDGRLRAHRPGHPRDLLPDDRDRDVAPANWASTA